MSRKKHRLPADKSGNYLAYRVGKTTGHQAEGDPLRLILASENPVRVFDWESWDLVDEVLRMDGLRFPNQVPLLNSHNRQEARAVIGSIRDLEVNGSQLEGNAYFASSEEAQDVKRLYDEGHLTDFSIGFQPEEVQRLKTGETATIRGKKYNGPLRIVRAAIAKEGSAVAIGADDQAKALRECPALRAYVAPSELKKEKEMDKLRDFCLTRGMPADTADEDIAQWMEDNLRSAAETDEHKEDEHEEETRETQKPIDERRRAAEITTLCDASDVSRAQTASYIASKLTVDQIAADILRKENIRKAARPRDSLSNGNNGDRFYAMESEDEKFREGALGALLNRCLMGINCERAAEHAKGIYKVGDREHHTYHSDRTALDAVQDAKRILDTPHSKDLRNLGLFEMARAFVTRDARNRRGITTRDVTFGMSRSQVVREALRLDMIYRDDPAYHTTGSFSNLLLDGAKKTLLMAYEEANVTFPLWTRQAPSTPDFKTINRIRLGEIPDPMIVPENDEYSQAAVGDNKESYIVSKYGNIFSISLEAIINDDLNAIARIPAQQGAAMRRKVNKVVYAVLTANAAMSDNVALFHATSHGANLDANALAVSALNTGWTVMATQTGLTSGVILNIVPRYLIVPSALSYTALQIANSVADPSNAAGSTEDAARPNFNSGTINVYGPQGSRPVMPIVDANLDASSPTAWYLAAEPNQVDTIEVCYLQGEETPFLDREEGFSTDSVRYKIRQTFGAAAIDYRGLYQGNS